MLAHRRRKRNQKGTLAEFAPTLLVLMAVLLFVVSMLSLVCGYGSLMYGCQLAAREAASSPNFATAKRNVVRIRQQIVESNFGKFGGITNALTPDGLTLEVLQLVDGQNAAQLFTPGQPVNTANSYQYRVSAAYNIKPIFWPNAFAARAESTAVVEHPEGLSFVNN